MSKPRFDTDGLFWSGDVLGENLLCRTLPDGKIDTLAIVLEMRGMEHGRIAQRRALQDAMERLGYVPSILRKEAADG